MAVTAGEVKTGWIGGVLPYLYRMSLDNSAEFYIDTLELRDKSLLSTTLAPLFGENGKKDNLSITTLASLTTPIDVDLEKEEASASKLRDANIIKILTKSVRIDNIQFQDVKEWIGSAWAYTTGVHELQQVSITFRDINGGTLYNNFRKFLALSKNLYPNQQKWNMIIKKASFHGRKWNDYRKLDAKDESGDNAVLNTEHAVLRGLSGLDLDSDSSGFSTFTAEFILDPFPQLDAKK